MKKLLVILIAIMTGAGSFIAYKILREDNVFHTSHVGFLLRCKFRVKLRIDDEFTSSEHAVIVEAARRWHVASDKKICFTITETKIGLAEAANYFNDQRSTIYSGNSVWHSITALVRHGCNMFLGCLGVTVGSGDGHPDIFIVRKQRFLNLMIHEMGHLIGIGHSPHKGDIMFPDISNADSITHRDISVLNCLMVNSGLKEQNKIECKYKEKPNVGTKKRPADARSPQGACRFPHSFQGQLSFSVPQKERMGLGE